MVFAPAAKAKDHLRLQKLRKLQSQSATVRVSPLVIARRRRTKPISERLLSTTDFIIFTEETSRERITQGRTFVAYSQRVDP